MTDEGPRVPPSSAVDLHLVADHMPAMVSYIDAEERYRYVNARYGDWYGIEPQRIPGMRVRDLLGTARYASVRHHIRAALSGEVVNFEIRGISERRGARWLSVRYVPDVAGGRVRGFFALVTDVTEAKEAEKVLRDAATHAHSLVRAILETAVDGIVTIDEQGIVESISPAAQEMFGYVEDEVLGRNVSMLMPEPYRSEHDGYIARHRAAGARATPVRRREVVGLRKDGAAFPMEISVKAVTWDRKRGFAGIVRDLTEQRRLEQEFLQAQKMEAVGRLAGGIAHDFNNVLTGIIGGCRLARSQLDERHPARALLDEVSAQAERGAGLSRQLLTFSRKRRTSLRPVELNQIVGQARGMVDRLVGPDVAVRCELDPGGGPVLADPIQIEQVLMNLVVNARDAMPHGGELTLRTAEVEAGSEAAGRWVVLEVRDTGVGMDAATRARVFEPFFTTKAPGQGTGLGLSTVYGIVGQLGGQVRVASAPGQGATFTVLLPRHAAERVAAPPRTPERAGGGGRTVLLVEDEPLVRAAVSYVLAQHGYTVLEARDGDEARRACARHDGEIDLLLTDVVLPGAAGPELAREIEERRPGIATLFMSAYPSEYLVEHGKLLPDQPSLAKPFTDDELLARVTETLAAGPPRRSPPAT